MTLPRPKKKSANKLLTQIGGTWIDIDVNSVFQQNSFQNWSKSFKGYLRGDGKWDIAKGQMSLPFFCVGSKDDHTPKYFDEIGPKPIDNGENYCGNEFLENNELFRGGKWAVKQQGTTKYKNFDRYNVKDYLSDISLGTQVRYMCGNRIPTVRFICARTKDKKEAQFFKCFKNCGTFVRKPIKMTDFIRHC